MCSENTVCTNATLNPCQNGAECNIIEHVPMCSCKDGKYHLPLIFIFHWLAENIGRNYLKMKQLRQNKIFIVKHEL